MATPHRDRQDVTADGVIDSDLHTEVLSESLCLGA
jgi:hypothetical protein